MFLYQIFVDMRFSYFLLSKFEGGIENKEAKFDMHFDFKNMKEMVVMG